MNAPRVIRSPKEWAVGRNLIIAEVGQAPAFGVEFAVFRQKPGERTTHSDSKREQAFVLMSGSATISLDGVTQAVSRSSLFDSPPTCVHAARGGTFTLEAGSQGAEWTVVAVTNPRPFEARIFLPGDVEEEWRGKGLVQEASLRNVRLIFDSKSRPESKLVVGEVVNLAGRWSSYPPHHHAQPELYHYRFTLPQGYGHAEMGEEVFKVYHGDTSFISPGKDHSQVAGPGYGMYYLWVVKHLEGSPYVGPEFTEEHKWLLDPTQQGWRPK